MALTGRHRTCKRFCRWRSTQPSRAVFWICCLAVFYRNARRKSLPSEIPPLPPASSVIAQAVSECKLLVRAKHLKYTHAPCIDLAREVAIDSSCTLKGRVLKLPKPVTTFESLSTHERNTSQKRIIIHRHAQTIKKRAAARTMVSSLIYQPPRTTLIAFLPTPGFPNMSIPCPVAEQGHSVSPTAQPTINFVYTKQAGACECCQLSFLSHFTGALQGLWLDMLRPSHPFPIVRCAHV